MRTSLPIVRLFGSATLALAATACSSGSALPPSPGAATSPVLQTMSSVAEAQPAKKAKALLYVADYEEYKVYVFDQTTKKKPVLKYTISDGINAPTGITTDKAGNLYVCNEFGSGSKGGRGSVTIYKPGSKTPFETITTGVNGPEDVAVDGAGNIFVANNPIYGTTQPWINEYLAGSESPLTTWYPPETGVVITSLAIEDPNSPEDEQIYSAYFYENSGSYYFGNVMVCTRASGCTAGGFSLGETGGIAIEQSQLSSSEPVNFLVVDQNVPGVDDFSDNVLEWQHVTGNVPQDLALDSTRSKLFVSNLDSVDEYSYPSMKLVTSYHPKMSGGRLFGVAVSPAGTYF